MRKYEIKIILGYSRDGTPISTSVFTDIYPEIEIVDLEKIDLIVEKSVNVEKVANIWLDSIKPSIKPQTFHKYQTIVNLYVIPYLGFYDIKKINEININRFLEKMSISGGNNKQGLSYSSLKTITYIVKKILKYSYNYGYRNIMIGDVIIPKKREKSKIKVLDEKDSYKLITYLKSNPKYINIGLLFSICCGLRIGEVCTLKGEDIDYQKKILSIKHTMQRISIQDDNNKTKVVISSPKSQSSYRNVPIPNILIDVLKEIKYNDNDYVLTGDNKKFIEPRRLSKYFKNILKYLDIKDTNYHTLRHTFASMCIVSGMDDRTLSEILGHSSVNITLNRYVHPTMKTKQEMINKVFK